MCTHACPPVAPHLDAFSQLASLLVCAQWLSPSRRSGTATRASAAQFSAGASRRPPIASCRSQGRRDARPTAAAAAGNAGCRDRRHRLPTSLAARTHRARRRRGVRRVRVVLQRCDNVSCRHAPGGAPLYVVRCGAAANYLRDLDVALLRPEQPADAVRARWRSQWSQLRATSTGADDRDGGARRYRLQRRPLDDCAAVDRRRARRARLWARGGGGRPGVRTFATAACSLNGTPRACASNCAALAGSALHRADEEAGLREREDVITCRRARLAHYRLRRSSRRRKGPTTTCIIRQLSRERSARRRLRRRRRRTSSTSARWRRRCR